MEKTNVQLFKEYVEKWIRLIEFPLWDIKVVSVNATEFVSRFPEFNAFTVAACTVQWQYLKAVITVNLNALDMEDPDNIEFIVIHELMHIMVNELREEGIEHEERVCTVLAKSFCLVHNNNGSVERDRRGR